MYTQLAFKHILFLGTQQVFKLQELLTPPRTSPSQRPSIQRTPKVLPYNTRTRLEPSMNTLSHTTQSTPLAYKHLTLLASHNTNISLSLNLT